MRPEYDSLLYATFQANVGDHFGKEGGRVPPPACGLPIVCVAQGGVPAVRVTYGPPWAPYAVSHRKAPRRPRSGSSNKEDSFG